MTAARKKVLAISGSTRRNSTNHHLLRAIADLTADQLEITIFNSIADIPHFNPDLDGDNIPAQVQHFRDLLRSVDGVIICTPEYAHGVPGSLKNAIDWTVSSSEFSQRPTVLITASTDGRSSHGALLETLRVIEAGHVDRLQLLIQFARTKIDTKSQIIDEGTLQDVRKLMDAFIQALHEHVHN